MYAISIACGGLAMWIGSPTEALAKCALCLLMFNMVVHASCGISSSFEELFNEVSRND
ncbi:TPA: hypothetical protein RQL20_003192 [Vibrio vulnificus]|nr:hypothetical protein [Vibrio vulnificus]